MLLWHASQVRAKIYCNRIREKEKKKKKSSTELQVEVSAWIWGFGIVWGEWKNMRRCIFNVFKVKAGMPRLAAKQYHFKLGLFKWLVCCQCCNFSFAICRNDFLWRKYENASEHTFHCLLCCVNFRRLIPLATVGNPRTKLSSEVFRPKTFPYWN